MPLVLLAALLQPPPAASLPLQLAVGQELHYRGRYVEQAVATGSPVLTRDDVDVRWFVLGMRGGKFDLACLTVTKPAGERGASSARLEVQQTDPFCQQIADPLPNGTPALETAALPPRPQEPLAVGTAWTLGATRRVLAEEAVAGRICWKLSAAQQSADWTSPQDGHTAWKRTDTIWLANPGGYAVRVERRIEYRTIDADIPARSALLEYELESAPVYSGSFAEQRRREIDQYRQFFEAFVALQPGAARAAELLKQRIAFHTGRGSATPYRAAIDWLQPRIDERQRGLPVELALTAATLSPAQMPK